jgi:hypothetical protein
MGVEGAEEDDDDDQLRYEGVASIHCRPRPLFRQDNPKMSNPAGTVRSRFSPFTGRFEGRVYTVRA